MTFSTGFNFEKRAALVAITMSAIFVLLIANPGTVAAQSFELTTGGGASFYTASEYLDDAGSAQSLGGQHTEMVGRVELAGIECNGHRFLH